jgi:hypothetical protein
VQTFFWQLPYFWEGAGPSAYVTPHFPAVQVGVPSDAHGPAGGAGQSLALVQPPPLLVLPVLVLPVLLLPLLELPPPVPGNVI